MTAAVDTSTGEILTAGAAVMELKRRITSISKEGFNSQGNFNFRGIDQAVNAAGPIERELGILVLPKLLSIETQQVEYGAKRTLGFHTKVQVAYEWYSPATDTRMAVGPFPGEAMDSGDKGTAKAMSVALRTMYLQVLTVPTGEPDPDQSTYEVAKPESATTDPVVEAKLRERIAKADTEAKLRSAYDAVLAEFGGDKATISVPTRDALVDLVGARLRDLAPDIEQRKQQAAGRSPAAGLGPEARRSASTNAAGLVHPAAVEADRERQEAQG